MVVQLSLCTREESEMSHLETTLRYLKAVEAGDTEALAAFYAPGALQKELPNRLNPRGVTRSINALKAASAAGKRSVSEQHYQVLHAQEHGDTVAVEAEWTATLAVPLGALKAGDTMRASLAMFFTFAGGKIVSQRNYDCFEPF
jgi:ketosteroid isomerase-like protein